MDLTFDLVEETTNLVERTHDAVVERSSRWFTSHEAVESVAKAVTGIHTGISGGVFGSIRLINGLVRTTANAGVYAAEASVDRISRSDEAELAQSLPSGSTGKASRFPAFPWPSV